MIKKIVVDHLRCEHNGYCKMTAKSIIDQSDDGTPILLKENLDSIHEHDLALLAIKACPMDALKLEDVEGK